MGLNRTAIGAPPRQRRSATIPVAPSSLGALTDMSTTPQTGFEHRVVIGIAGLIASNDANATLMTYSLGACLGIAIYDPVARAGGLLHIMLPDSGIDPSRATGQPGMFVDTGIPALFRAAYTYGADKQRLMIYVAGGAQIMDTSGYFDIGRQNYAALVELIQKHELRIEAEHVGGLVNRTMSLNLATGRVALKISGQSSDTLILCKSSTTT